MTGYAALTYEERIKAQVTKRRMCRQQVLEICKEVGITFSALEREELVDRVTMASDKETVDMRDLRVLVRMFNREMAGRVRRYGRRK